MKKLGRVLGALCLSLTAAAVLFSSKPAVAEPQWCEWRDWRVVSNDCTFGFCPWGTQMRHVVWEQREFCCNVNDYNCHPTNNYRTRSVNQCGAPC
jgi:hypothetical protein